MNAKMNITKSATKHKPAKAKLIEAAERKLDFPVIFHCE